MVKKIKYYLLAFVLPILIFLVCATITDHFPFGKYYINMFDAYNMYPSLLMQSRRGILSDGLFFTFLAGLGTDYYNIHTLYMNSPFNYLFLLFKESEIFTFYNLLIYLRIGLLSISMFIYLNSLEKGKEIKKVAFSLCYALSTFSVAYAYHIMWMDSLILLPFIILGLDKLIENKNSFLYILFLSLELIINFYIGYMICIFCLLYFIYKSYIDDKLNKDNITRFIISSILSGLMSSIVLVPQIISLFNGRGHKFDSSALLGISRFTLRSYVYSFFPTSFIVQDNYMDGSIVLYSSLLVFVLNILVFFNKSISKRMKIATFIFNVFIFISSFVLLIDYTWNMFQSPVWWSHRYSFVFIFLFIVIAYKNTIDFQVDIKSKTKLMIFMVIFVLSFVSFCLKSMGLFLSSTKVIFYFISIVFISLYLLMINNKKCNYLIFIILILELGLNAYDVLSYNYYSSVSDAKKYIDKQKIIDRIDDKSFYRVKYVGSELDDGMLLNYNSASMFSSSYNNRVVSFLTNDISSFENAINSIDIQFANPAILSLFNIKYIISNESNYYSKYAEHVSINDKALPLGFVINNYKESNLLKGQGLLNIEKIYKDISGLNNKLFYKQKMENVELSNFELLKDGTLDAMHGEFTEDDIMAINKVKYDFIASHKGILVPITQDAYEYYKVIINGYEYDASVKEENDGLFKVDVGDKVEIIYTIVGYEYFQAHLEGIKLENLGVYILDYEVLNNSLDKVLTYDSLDNCKKIKNGLTCDIDVKNDGLLFTTIPYYSNYIIKLDNEKVSYIDIYDTFVGLNIKEGKHIITIKYVPKGFYFGVIISLISFFVTIVYLRLDAKNKK